MVIPALEKILEPRVRKTRKSSRSFSIPSKFVWDHLEMEETPF